ncbi:MAG: 3-deoxy-D-manno-octulosonic acid transferase [bacterium]
MTVLFFIIYNILVIIGTIIAVPVLLISRPSYLKHASERFGRLPDTKGCIWIHAASVGEVKASAALITRIASFGHRILLTTVTPAGRAYGSTLRIDNLTVSYLPVDNILSTLYAFHRVKPKALIIIETELWPNLLLAAIINRVHIVSVNARLTQKAFESYRYIYPVMKFLLKRFTFIGVQTVDDQKRFLSLGARADTIRVTGNIKYSIISNNASPFVQYLKRALENRNVIIAGSTHQGEESMIINCLLSLKHALNNPILIIAPRHLNRIADVEIVIQQAGLKYIKRSAISNDSSMADIDVLLMDTIGELADIYSIGDAIFVGGSMVPVGGHNVLEVVVHKKPVIYGLYVDTIKEFVSLLDGNGGIMVNNEQELCKAIANLIQHPQMAQSLGNRAHALVMEKVNTVNTVINALKEMGLL